MAAKPAGLGRGLNALIKEKPATPEKKASSKQPAPKDEGGVVSIPITQIHKSPWQPRRHFEPAALEELVASIRERGVLQPLLVRAVGDSYQLIAGERRFRASQIAELPVVPVVIMKVSDKEAVEITLIENLQREDLNPIEEAEGYQSLANEFGMTQEQIAERVNKGRASVANALRLLSLPENVRDAVAENRLSSGHAKVLLGLELPAEQEMLARRVLKEGLSVRALERMVEQMRRPARKPRAERHDIPASHLHHLSDRLHQTLGTSVRLHSSKTLSNGKKVPGSIEIDFYSNEDLDRLLQHLGMTEALG
jgi:ParB family transcriptional regulator, chromosome partitioning protein